MNDIDKNSDKNPLKVFETKWFSIDAIPNKILGEEPYYRLSCGDSVEVLAVTDDRKIILVRQFRPAVDREILEFPAGYINNKESIIEAAKRELYEETGFVCDSMEYINSFQISPSRINSVCHIFFGIEAKRKSESKNGVGEWEKTEVVTVSQDDFERMIREKEFTASEGLAAYLLAKMRNLL